MVRLLILAFAAGCALLQTRSALPPLAWAAALPPVILLAHWWPRAGPMGLVRHALMLGLALAAGLLYAAGRAELRLAQHLEPAWQGRTVHLAGRVVDLPERVERGWRLVFQAESVSPADAAPPLRLRLGLYPRPGEAWPEPRAGQCLHLVARLHPPHGSRNPHGFDYEAWLLQRGIRATGTVSTPPTPGTDCGHGARAWLDGLREDLRQHLMAGLGEAPYAGVVVALAVGDQNAIPDEQWTLFRHTGVTHLMSISGMHVTLFSALVFALVRWLWRRSARLCLALPANKAGLALGLAAAAAYVALSGFGIPAQRTLYMLASVVALLWLGMRDSPGRILAAALLAVMLLDPWAALAPGFWLSFGAVAALFHAGAGQTERPPIWKSWLQTQWVVTAALLPLLLAVFHEVSLVSPLANAFAIPLVSLVVVPLALLATVLPWSWPAWLAHAALVPTMTGLAWLDGLPQPVWHQADAGPVAVALALTGAALVLWPGLGRWRWLGTLLYLPLLLAQPARPGPGEAWLTVLDVGQGQAVVLRTHAHTLVYDTGPAYGPGQEAGSRTLAPYLHAVGVKRVDTLVVSHDDIDHSGGALGLADSLPVARLLSSLAGVPRGGLSPHGQAILARLPGAEACADGQGWEWDGVAFRMLHPPARHYGMPGFDDNDRSCVLAVSTRHGGLLLPGDVARLGEMNLLERLADRLPAQVLVAPHHGSGGSSSAAFLAAVAPATVLIPVGHRNRYGHPAPEALARYREVGAIVWRTDRQGALTVRFTAGGPRVETERSRDRRYWQSGS